MRVEIASLRGTNQQSGLEVERHYAVHRGPDAEGTVLVFDDNTCRELSTFVTGVREKLTDNIYPNLRQPTEDQRHLLRQALEQLGADISTARDRLEQLYREIAREG